MVRTVRREPLTRDRVLGAALALADEHGVDAVTMRAVGERLGVEGMALYRHVSGKDALLDGLVEVVLAEVTASCDDLPPDDPRGDWREALRRRVLRARSTVLRHPWAPALITARGTAGGATLGWFEAVCAILFRAGFSADLVHHALHALGSRVLGFTQELFAVDAPAALDADAALAEVRELSRTMPHLGRVVASMAHDASSTLGWCDDQAEFEFGLDVLLDGLEARRLRDLPT